MYDSQLYSLSHSCYHVFNNLTLPAERDREARALAIEKQELVVALDSHLSRVQQLSSENLRSVLTVTLTKHDTDLEVIWRKLAKSSPQCREIS